MVMNKLVKRKAWTGKVEYEYTGVLKPFNDECQLFHCKTANKWWLHYSKTSMTGSFKNKREAMAWYNRGGR